MTGYAVVVGIARYPGLTADKVVERDLESPDRDAEEVRTWLVDPQGGALDPGDVKLIRSADFAAAEPQPALARVQQEMDWLEERTSKRRAGGSTCISLVTGSRPPWRRGRCLPPRRRYGAPATCASTPGCAGCAGRSASARRCCGWTAA